MNLLMTAPEHFAGKVDPDNADITRGGQRQRQVSCSSTQIKHNFAAVQTERVDGARTPPLVKSGAKQTVEQVVVTSDGVEHLRYTVRRLIEGQG
jgi:hypothetical protein